MTEIYVPGLAEAKAHQPEQAPCVVSMHDQLVVLHFPRSIEYAAFTGIGAVDTAARMLAFAHVADPAMAEFVINVGMALIDHVYEHRGDLKPAGGTVKHELIERHRQKLTPRLTLMLNTLREERTTSNQQLARTIIDQMFSEIFS